MAIETGMEEQRIDLAYLLDIVLRRRWIVLTAIVLSVAWAAFYVLTTPPIFSSTALLLIEKEEKGRSASTDRIVTESTTDDYYQTQYRLLKSRSLLRKVHETLALAQTRDFPVVDSLINSVTITPVARSRLVNVTCDSHEPELATRIANGAAEAYVAQNLENRLFISKELLQTLYGKESAAYDDDFFSSLPAVVNNGMIQSLKSSYATLEMRQGDMASRYTADHPETKRLKAEMTAMSARIKQETAKAIRSMKAELSGQMLGNNVRIVDRAEIPTSPSKPNKRKILMLSVLFGILLGGALAFAIENIDRTIRTQEDIEQKLRLPFLGAVAKSSAFKSETSLEYDRVLAGTDSFIAESLKNVRTMIGFAGATKAIKTMLVTSAIQGEGKTFLAMNLARVFAQLGGKVLLIEGDLRRPSLHKRFALSKEMGISHFLAHGQSESDLAGLIQATATPNLKVLVCGPIPPNPAELLSTPRIKFLVDWAKQHFDHIFIDGTPVFPVTDALLWGREVDATLFVVQFAKVNLKLTLMARQKLQEGGLRIAGAVLNQVAWRSGSYGDYYYQYQYHYHANADQTPK